MRLVHVGAEEDMGHVCLASPLLPQSSRTKVLCSQPRLCLLGWTKGRWRLPRQNSQRQLPPSSLPGREIQSLLRAGTQPMAVAASPGLDCVIGRLIYILDHSVVCPHQLCVFVLTPTCVVCHNSTALTFGVCTQPRSPFL